MEKASITFGSWSAVSDDISTLVDRERKRMSGPWRVWELCVAKANNWGHAAFRPGELATLACGKDSPSNRDQVRRWLKILCDMGRIDPEHSTQVCVMVNRDVVQRRAGKGSRQDVCWESSHADIREAPYSPKAMEAPQGLEPSEDEPWGDDSESDLADTNPYGPTSTAAHQRLWG
jgi:hypothetical protein